MTARSDFNGVVSDWLAAEAGRGAPDYLDDILARTTRTRQRPTWWTLERWLPMSGASRTQLVPIPRSVVFVALVGALALVAVVLLLSAVGQQRPPSFGATLNGHIAYVDGDLIRIADADGTIGPQITTVPGGAAALTFSPDGRHLAYRALDASHPSIAIADSDGSHPILVPAGDGLVLEPGVWSPDSRRIAFVIATGSVEMIALVDADGTGVRVLTAPDATPTLDPAWSPDGNWIAFFSGPPESSAVSLIHPDGSGLRTLYTNPVDRDGLAWSPDPARLRLTYKSRDVAHSSSSQGPAFQRTFVRVYDLATTTEAPVAEASVLTGTGPAWSPDGTKISWWNDGTFTVVVVEALAGHGQPALVFPSVDGGCLEHAALAGRAICGPAAWSPDSRWLFGPGIGGTSIVFGRSDGSGSPHAITLDHPGDNSGTAAWQAVAP
jgi:Tol biopolymer transport system component